MLEKTFVMIKPDHVELSDRILDDLDRYAKRITSVRVDAVPREIIEDHYSCHKGKPFFGFMTDSFVGRPVVLAVYEGENIIRRFMDIIGPTDPSKAPPYTIRGKYSNDSLEIALSEKRPVRNVAHRSDSSPEFARESYVWRDYLDIDY